MGNRKKYGVTILILMTIVFLTLAYKVYKDTQELDIAFQAIEYCNSLYFEEIDETIFFKTRQWGLLGGHSRIMISEDSSSIPNEDIDVIFDLSLLYYKKISPDSLIIFIPSMSYSEDTTFVQKVGTINLKIHKFKASQNRKFETAYKDMGLVKITTSDGFE